MEMNDRSKGGSPYRRHQNDEEAAAAATEEEAEASSGGGGPFQIFRTKDASVDRLKRWREQIIDAAAEAGKQRTSDHPWVVDRPVDRRVKSYLVLVTSIVRQRMNDRKPTREV
ncbi:hypothetical protein CsSME_00051556 [Camellia sinensis var. sinensis]